VLQIFRFKSEKGKISIICANPIFSLQKSRRFDFKQSHFIKPLLPQNHHHYHHPNPAIHSTITATSFIMSPSNTPITCPFELCKRPFKQQSDMKNHLRLLKGSGGDWEHPPDHPEWQRMESINFLVRYTRSKTAPQEIKDERKREAWIRHYAKNKHNLLALAKTRRQSDRNKVDIVDRVGEYAKKAKGNLVSLASAMETIEAHAAYNKNFVRSIFLPPPALDEFAHLDEPVSVDRYPRMVVYLLGARSLPSILQAIPGETRILDVLPNQSCFHRASNTCHTDKHGGSAKYIQYLTEGWNLWKPYFHNYSARRRVESCGRGSGMGTEVETQTRGNISSEVESTDSQREDGDIGQDSRSMNDQMQGAMNSADGDGDELQFDEGLDEKFAEEIVTLTVVGGEEEEDALRAKGEVYNTLADMYWAYTQAYTDILKVMDATAMPAIKLHLAYQDEKNGGELPRIDPTLVGGDSDVVIQEALQAKVKGKRGRKHKQPVVEDSTTDGET
jgi:hypothetical protein